MTIRYALVPVVLAVIATAGAVSAANLQTQDLFFVSTHRFPVQVESDDKTAFLLTEGGVLMYDYRRRQWQDNIAPGLGVRDIAFSPSQNRLLMLTRDGAVLEYNPAFRRVNPSSQPFERTGTGGPGGDLSGLSLGNDFFFLGDAVRDRYNRRAPVVGARVFEYDNMWLLTAGHGAFLGSQRRKDLTHNAFGLHDSSVTAMHTDGRSIWFGSHRSDGALVRATSELSGWTSWLAQQDFQFPDGAIFDIVTWRNQVWLATRQGVVRQDPTTGRFTHYRRMLGSQDLRVNRLFVHGDRLYAGTERGIAVLAEPSGQFQGEETPLNMGANVRDFHSTGRDLWAATDFGLLVLTPAGWRTIRDVTREDVPEAFGVRVASVAFHDTSLYWAADDRLYVKPRRREARTLFTQNNIFRIVVDGNILYAAHDFGVRAWNLRNGLWTDFRLEHGIPGRRVQSIMVHDGFLWIGTDLGAMRIRVRPYLP